MHLCVFRSLIVLCSFCFYILIQKFALVILYYRSEQIKLCSSLLCCFVVVSPPPPE